MVGEILIAILNISQQTSSVYRASLRNLTSTEASRICVTYAYVAANLNYTRGCITTVCLQVTRSCGMDAYTGTSLKRCKGQLVG